MKTKIPTKGIKNVRHEPNIIIGGIKIVYFA